jgi:hypothetical protein
MACALAWTSHGQYQYILWDSVLAIMDLMGSILQRSASPLLLGSVQRALNHSPPDLTVVQPISLVATAWMQWLRKNVSSACSENQDQLNGPRTACLNDIRGVMRLSGEDVHHFLNVSPRLYALLV